MRAVLIVLALAASSWWGAPPLAAQSVRLGGQVCWVVAVRKKHHINISAVIATRITRRESSHTSFTEFTGTVGYSYAFGGR